MIVTFECQETEKIWNGEVSRKFPIEIQQTARRRLVHVNSTISINDLRVHPGNRLEKHKGDYREYYSIRINQKWHIVFIWNENNAHKVKIVDYH